MYAQTNIQLFEQLQSDGYRHEELTDVLNAYGLGIRLFAGLYRASGEPFIIHQIGTASILSSLHVPAGVVAAGLIHAAYTHGDFGCSTKAISEAKRERVRRAVGTEVEAYVARYTALPWTRQNIITVRESFSRLDHIDRHVVLMRLADILEKHHDREILYYHPDLGCVRQYLQRYGPIMVELAGKLGFPMLAAELQSAFRQLAFPTTVIPAELRKPTDQKYASVVAPQSYRRQLWIALYEEAARWHRFVRRAVSTRHRHLVQTLQHLCLRYLRSGS